MGVRVGVGVRAARPEELPLLQAIEVAAGAPFRALGMDRIADDAPPPLDVLRTYQRAGLAWVAVDAADTPVGYLIAEPVDGCLHVEQVSVHPASAGQRHGERLLAHAATWASDHGLAALTLTTFTDVPWNAPLYLRYGFRALAPAELTQGLGAIRAHEAELGLDAWPRTAMRRDLPGSGEGPSDGEGPSSGEPLPGP